jgi:hypothetical protein
MASNGPFKRPSSKWTSPLLPYGIEISLFDDLHGGLSELGAFVVILASTLGIVGLILLLESRPLRGVFTNMPPDMNRPPKSTNTPLRRPRDISVVETVVAPATRRKVVSSKGLRPTKQEAEVQTTLKEREAREAAARAKAKARAAREAARHHVRETADRQAQQEEALRLKAREAADRQAQHEEAMRLKVREAADRQAQHVEAMREEAREAADRQAQQEEAMRMEATRAAQLRAMEAESRRLAEAMQAVRDGSTDTYLSEVSEMLCLVCQELLDGPVTTACGHSFCSKCLRQAIDICGNVCPACRSALPSALPKLNIVLEKLVAPHRGRCN